mgnify:FL=1
MPDLNIYDQLQFLIHKLQRDIAQIDEAYPLKKWFSIELEMFTPGPRESSSFEDVSARMRAVRQLEFMVTDALHGAARSPGVAESAYTQMSRVPSSLLDAVRQTNFSIEPSLLLEDAEPVDLFDLVSPTAKVVSYLRNLDNSLSFAERLSCPDESRALLDDLGIVDPGVQQHLSTLFRSRYDCINSVIERHAAYQVLEIGAGISPRGLHWSREHPGTVYIESDLPSLMRVKAKSLRDSILDDDTDHRGVLHCCGLDALNLDSLRHALEYTDPEAALVIVTEGVLLYFSADEMQQFLQNMHTILTERPRAVWVVDMVSRQNLTELCDFDPSVATAVRSVFGATQRAVMSANPFPDDDSISTELKSAGLRVVSQTLLRDPARRDAVPPDGDGSCTGSICGSRKIWAIAAAGERTTTG